MIQLMSNKRELKRAITQQSSCLFAECVAMSLYGGKEHREDMDVLLNSIIRINNEYVSRVSHPEPGMKAKLYYRSLVNSFQKDVDEIIDHINNV